MTTEHISREDTSKYVRGALKRAFPAIKFSIRASRGSALDVQWIDGPTSADVDLVVWDYRGASFDSSQDLSSPVNAWLYKDGRAVRTEQVLAPEARKVSFAFDYIQTKRELSLDFVTRATPIIAKKLSLPAPEIVSDEIWIAGKPVATVGGTYKQNYTLAWGNWTITDVFIRELYKMSEAQLSEQVVENANGVKIVYDRDWTWVTFPGKPSAEIRAGMVALGFGFSKGKQAWYSYEIVSEDKIHALMLPVGNVVEIPIMPIPAPVKPVTDPKKAEKMRKLADSFDGEIARKRATHSGANLTRKRQGEIDHANREADKMQYAQAVLRELADRWEVGDVPELLRGVTTKKAALDLGTEYSRWEKYKTEKWYINDATYQTEPIRWVVSLLEGKCDPRAEKLRKLENLKRKCLLDNVGFDYFPTPYPVAHEVVGSVRVPRDGGLILEPEAGTGGLACVAREWFPHHEIHCVEWSYTMREILELQDFKVVGEDIMDYAPADTRYALALMNPPFSNDVYVAHIQHVWELIEPGGQLMSIVPSGIKFRNGKVGKFREWVNEHGYIVDLPDGAFKESGTGTSVCCIVLTR